MTGRDRAPRVALLVNMVAPYRVALYDEIARYLDLDVLYSGHEDNRVGWEGADRRLERARARRVWGWVFKRKRPSIGRPGSVRHWDLRYLHISPGYGIDLVRSRPAAIITCEMGLRTLTAIGYGLLTGIPVWVMIESSLHSERHPGPVRSLVRAAIARLAHRWIAVGECSAEYLASRKVPESRITTIQNTVDERPFSRVERFAPAVGEKPIALHVGQLVHRKGVALLLEAVATLSARGIGISVVIAGDGPERHQLEARARELMLSDVSFVGQCPTDQIAALLARASFLVFPTLDDVWGLVVNEALWSGVPVLGSCHAGCAKELLPTRNIFDPLDHDGFVEALERAALGGLAPADRTRLWSTAKAARRVAGTVLAALGSRVAYSVDPSISGAHRTPP